MKAKRIMSTEKEDKVLLEMNTYEAQQVFDILSRVVVIFDTEGFECEFWGSEYDVAKSAENFKSILGLQ